MAPKKTAANTGENVSGTPNADFRILDTVLKACTFDDKPKSMNFNYIAKQLGFKNSATARERWRQVCKKNNWYCATDSNAAASPASRDVAAKRFAEVDLEVETPVEKSGHRPSDKKIKLEYPEYQAEQEEYAAWDDIPREG
ncbi:hypothetical protein GGR53DRAFT_467568 [Hypoxylon sp. FL1150]|nr:hypothetical protein GGR53DRAFT_467568 [Hypoxylon sp. FL1150]